MSVKALSWILFAAIALGAVLLFNYWASYQLLSTLAYTGIVAALAGVANLLLPFRFLGFRKRAVGALILAGGTTLAFAALFWPAAIIRVAQPRTRLDAVIPEYQFSERHAIRIHARPGQVMQAIRQSTFGDMKSLITLLKIRGIVLRTAHEDTGVFSRDRRILDAFAASGYLFDTSEHEIAMFGAANVRSMRRPEVRTLREFADYREPGAVKMGYNFTLEEAAGGWSTLTAETRVAVQDDASHGPAIYWRLIVPGSGLLRRQWLDGIKRRAESGL